MNGKKILTDDPCDMCGVPHKNGSGKEMEAVGMLWEHNGKKICIQCGKKVRLF